MMTNKIRPAGIYERAERECVETPVAAMTVQDKLRQLNEAIEHLSETINELEKRLDPIVMRVPVPSPPETCRAESSDSQLGAALGEMRERVSFMRDKLYSLLMTVQL